MHLDVLAFGPHSDDVELGCGGLLLKLKDLGYTTGAIDLTEAELSTNGDVSKRRLETEKASSILGLDFRQNLGLGDCRIKNDDESRLKVIEVIRQYRPELAIIPFSRDRHPDHENSHKLLKDAIFIAGLEKFITSYGFHRPATVLCYMLNYQFEPSFIVDISAYHEKKMEACKVYSSQFYSKEENSRSTYINSRFFREMMAVRDKFYGLKIKTDYGEPYFLDESIKIDDPISFFKYLH
ncbi:MAG: bacillithiol biosynthesis deacetylase BshB1 [Actinobacteria bacterium]|nr:bacillithiol biosynthesis deacetylase BshB1 [Actinomycetota bacterium]